MLQEEGDFTLLTDPSGGFLSPAMHPSVFLGEWGYAKFFAGDSAENGQGGGAAGGFGGEEAVEFVDAGGVFCAEGCDDVA